MVWPDGRSYLEQVTTDQVLNHAPPRVAADLNDGYLERFTTGPRTGVFPERFKRG